MTSSSLPTGTIMSKRIRHFPNNIVYSGYVQGASLSGRGSGGYPWSSTGSSSNSNAFSVRFESNYIAPSYTFDKYQGRTVRCIINPTYTVTLRAGNGISGISLSGWTDAGNGTLTKNLREGETIDLSTITTTSKTGYSGAKYIKNDSTSGASLSGSTYTVGAGSGDITISATSLDTPVCTMKGGATRVYNYANTTLTATSNASNYDTSSANITYSFGYASSATADLGNFGATQAGNTISVAKDLFFGSRYYGVRVTVTDKNDSTITNTCTSGTGSSTGNTVNNRTTMTLRNSRINLNATANGGTLSVTGTIYVRYGGTETYSAINNSTHKDIPLATPPTGGYVFTGWWTAQEGGSQVIDGSGNIQAGVTSWTNASGQWIRSGTSNNGTSYILYAQYACPANTICFGANANNTEGTMGKQTVAAGATETTLYPSNYSRTGYGFAGWSDAADWSSNQNAHFYGPIEDITFAAGQYSTAGLSLYAVWIESAGNLQGWNGCSSLTPAVYSNEGDSDEYTWSITANLDSITALTDTRDNQTYAVARLSDGKCWMIENLRLDNVATLTLVNTNNPLNDGTNITLKHNYTDTTTYNTLSPTSSVAYDENTAPEGWCTTSSAACIDQSRLRTDNTANRSTYDSNATMSTNVNLYSYGNYYNWYSATAGRGTYSTGTNETTVGDLCPTSWHLPSAGSLSDFYSLVNSLGFSAKPTTDTFYKSKRIRHFPNNFVYSGEANGASLLSRGSGFSYWSSVSSTNDLAKHMYYSSSGFYPDYSSSKYQGQAVRCVINPT